MKRLAIIVLLFVGCAAAPPPRNCVSGAVTLGGQPFEGGIVVLRGNDGAEATGAILPGGLYSIDDPPLGECDVAVRPPPGFDTPTPLVANDPHAPPPEKKTRIPKRYSEFNNGLKVDVKPGRSVYDIFMVP